MGRQIGNKTLEEKLDTVKRICESYLRGNLIVSCCKAHGISYQTLAKWCAKHPEVCDLYHGTLKQQKQDHAEKLISLSKSALEISLQPYQYEETIESEELVPIIDKRGKITGYDRQIKKTVYKKVKMPSTASALKILSKLDDKFKEKQDEVEINSEERKEEYRKSVLDEKLRELDEADEQDED